MLYLVLKCLIKVKITIVVSGVRIRENHKEHTKYRETDKHYTRYKAKNKKQKTKK